LKVLSEHRAVPRTVLTSAQEHLSGIDRGELDHRGACFEYFEKTGMLWAVSTHRKTRSITASTAVAAVPRDALDMERRAREKLSILDDEAIVEVRIDAPTATKALFPVGLLRRYLEAQEVDGRELLVFDSDEEVSSEVAARMLGVSRPFLNELLEVETISYRRVGNQRRIRVLALHEYSERRKTAEAGLRQMADVINESAGGWDQ
jgi:excisionase family DNA binding protein